MHFVATKKKIKTEKFGEFEVEFPQVPQCDTVEEMVAFYGGEKEFLERNNKILARAATQTSVLRLGSTNAADQAALDEQIAKEKQSAKDYKPEVTSGVSAKTAKAGVDALQDLATKNKDLFSQMNPDEILAYLTTQTLPERLQKAAA